MGDSGAPPSRCIASPSPRSPVPASRIRRCPCEVTSTQEVLPPIRAISGPDVATLPRTPQNRISMVFPLSDGPTFTSIPAPSGDRTPDGRAAGEPSRFREVLPGAGAIAGVWTAPVRSIRMGQVHRTGAAPRRAALPWTLPRVRASAHRPLVMGMVTGGRLRARCSRPSGGSSTRSRDVPETLERSRVRMRCLVGHGSGGACGRRLPGDRVGELHEGQGKDPEAVAPAHRAPFDRQWGLLLHRPDVPDPRRSRARLDGEVEPGISKPLPVTDQGQPSVRLRPGAEEDDRVAVRKGKRDLNAGVRVVWKARGAIAADEDREAALLRGAHPADVTDLTPGITQLHEPALDAATQLAIGEGHVELGEPPREQPRDEPPHRAEGAGPAAFDPQIEPSGARIERRDQGMHRGGIEGRSPQRLEAVEEPVVRTRRSDGESLGAAPPLEEVRTNAFDGAGGPRHPWGGGELEVSPGVFHPALGEPVNRMAPSLVDPH